MEITITLKHGSLNAEFVGEDREEIEQELLQFSEFLEENSEILQKVVSSRGERHSQEPEQAEVTQSWDSKSKEIRDTTKNRFSDVAERARVDQESLVEFLNMPSDEEKVPYLRLDCFEQEEEILGSARYERQGRASLILCYLWQEFRGVEEVDSSNLNEALHISGINPKNRKNMYKALDGDADGYFKRDSSGDVGLTQGGELAAVDEITRLAEELQSQ